MSLAPCLLAPLWLISPAQAQSTTGGPALTLNFSSTLVSAGSAVRLAWSAPLAKSCNASDSWTASSLPAAGSQVLFNRTKSGWYTVSCSNAAGTTSRTTLLVVKAAVVAAAPPAAGAVARPSYNSGNGFFVLNGKLYDPDGLEFRLRGVNRAHYDSDSEAGIVKSGANAVRLFVDTQYGVTWQGLVNIVQNQHIAHQQVAIPTDAGGAGGGTSCSTDNAVLNTAVSTWVANAPLWKTLDRYQIINIANEWGPRNSATWRDQYIAAIKALRAAGYTSPLMVDSGGCGQDQADLLNYSDDVFNADPQKNVIFSFHVYGGTASVVTALNFFSQLQALQKSVGTVFVIGEFGPGRDIGPSPTLVKPGQVIAAAEAGNLGWLAWAWDDNYLSGCASDDSSFSMTYKCGQYAQTSDLTLFGQDVVENGTYGLQKLAKKANW